MSALYYFLIHWFNGSNFLGKLFVVVIKDSFPYNYIS